MRRWEKTVTINSGDYRNRLSSEKRNVLLWNTVLDRSYIIVCFRK